MVLGKEGAAEVRFRANITSAGSVITREQLRMMLDSPWTLARVQVFSTALGRIVGYAGEFELIGDDVWGWLELEDDTPKAKRCAGVIIRRRDGLRLAAVFYTDLSPDELRRMGAMGLN